MKKAKARLVKRRVPKSIDPKGYVWDLKVGKTIRTRSIGYQLGIQYVNKINSGQID